MLNSTSTMSLRDFLMVAAQEDPALHERVENSEIANPNYGVPPMYDS